MKLGDKVTTLKLFPRQAEVIKIHGYLNSIDMRIVLQIKKR